MTHIYLIPHNSLSYYTLNLTCIGTNDLTQMTFGFSRDDVGTFLPVYLKNNLLEDDPFEGKLRLYIRIRLCI